MDGTRTGLHSEDGHALPLVGALVAAVGAIIMMIGQVNDQDATGIIGGIVLAVGLLAMPLLNHIGIDYGQYRRLEELEGKAKEM